MCVCVCYNRTGRTPPRDTHYGTSAIQVYEIDGAGSSVRVGMNLDQRIAASMMRGSCVMHVGVDMELVLGAPQVRLSSTPLRSVVLVRFYAFDYNVPYLYQVSQFAPVCLHTGSWPFHLRASFFPALLPRLLPHHPRVLRPLPFTPRPFTPPFTHGLSFCDAALPLCSW